MWSRCSCRWLWSKSEDNRLGQRRRRYWSKEASEQDANLLPVFREVFQRLKGLRRREPRQPTTVVPTCDPGDRHATGQGNHEKTAWSKTQPGTSGRKLETASLNRFPPSLPNFVCIWILHTLGSCLLTNKSKNNGFFKVSIFFLCLYKTTVIKYQLISKLDSSKEWNMSPSPICTQFFGRCHPHVPG